MSTHPAGPWGNADPIAWALSTGRLHSDSAERWSAELDRDPAATSAALASLFPAGLLSASLGAQLSKLEQVAAKREDEEYARLFPPTSAPVAAAAAHDASREEALFDALFPPGSIRR